MNNGLLGRLETAQDERDYYKARLDERELDWLNQQEQIKDQQVRLDEAMAMLIALGCAAGVLGILWWALNKGIA